MSKKISRNIRNYFKPFLFGAVLSGSLLLPGAAGIPGSGPLYNVLFAANNVNQDVSNGGTITDTTLNTGLTGTNAAGNITVSGTETVPAVAVVGQLNTESENLYDVETAVNLVLGEGYTFSVGSTTDGTTSLGALYIIGTGTGESAANSTLTINSGANLSVLAGSTFQIGYYNEGTPVQTGGLIINGTFTNAGNYDNYGTLTVNNGGSFTTNNTWNIDLEGQSGLTNNFGKITVNNTAGQANRAYFAGYTDYDSENSVFGQLYTDGSLQIGTTAASVQGILNVQENYYSNVSTTFSPVKAAEEAAKTAGLDSAVYIKGLVQMGVEGQAEDAVTLNIGVCNNIQNTDNTYRPNVIVGGIQFLNPNSGTDPQLLLQGTDSSSSSTASTGAFLQVNGLTSKFDSTGAQSTTGVYDVWLEDNFQLNGASTLLFNDTTNKTSGMRFAADSAINKNAIMQSVGDFNLGAALADTTATNVSLTVNGLLRVTDGELFLQNLIENNTDGKVFNLINAGNGQTSGSGTSATTTYSYVDTLNLTDDTAIFTNTGTFQFKNLTINAADTTPDTPNTAVFLSGADSITAVNQMTVQQGTAQLGGKLSGLTGTGLDTATLTITGNAANNEQGILKVSGTAATISGLAVQFANNGIITSSADTDVLTFENTVLTNNTALTSDLVSVNTVNFTRNLDTSKSQSANFISNAGSTFSLQDGATLNFTGGDETGYFTYITVLFDKVNGQDNDVLSFGDGNGTVTMDANTMIQTDKTNLASLKKGNYARTFVKTTDGTNNQFNAMIEDLDSLFYTFSSTKDASNTEMTLNLSIKGFDDFGTTSNQKAVGSYIEGLRTDGQAVLSDNLANMLNNIAAESSTAAEIESAYDQLSGVQRANSMMLAMDSPWTTPFTQMSYGRHLVKAPSGSWDGCCGDASYYRGQLPQGYNGYENLYSTQPQRSAIFEGYDLVRNSSWGTAYHTSFKANSDGNSADYGISRTGTRIGMDWVNCMDTIAGFTMGYSRPYLYSDTQRIEMNNVHLGLYGGRQNDYGFGIKGYLGAGFQDYHAKRSVSIPTIGLNDLYTSRNSGNSLAAAIQISKEFMIDCNYIIRPVLQFDMQQVWTEEVSEGTAAAALNYEKGDWNRSFGRIGLESELNEAFFQFTGRAYYGIQLGGDSAPEMGMSFANATNGGNMMIQGVDLGESFYDLGIGALGYLDCAKRWSISGNYDYTGSNESSAHTGEVALTFLF
ncbi:MAG: autotransporter domain-containing protein [Planctomycetia bacterium]|nr:autotransporter domain-containing protein [Planctomycetia bacterium]